MKILLLSDGIVPESHGGAEVVAWESAKALLKAGQEVFIITTTRSQAKEGCIEREGIKIHTLYSDYHDRWRAYISLYNSQVLLKIKELISEIKPDVVHAHNVHHYLSYHSLKLAKQSGAKVFLTAHDVMLFHYGKLVEFIDPHNISQCDGFDYHVSAWQQIKRFKRRYNPFRNLIIRHYLKYVDTIFAVSAALKDALNQNGIKKVEVLHNGIDIDSWGSGRSVDEFRHKHNLLDKKVILFGGRITKTKGGDQAIRIIEKVSQQFPEAILLIIGDRTAYVEELMAEARENGIERNVVCTGWISGDELKAAYHASGVVVMPSICFDTFGMVCLEAMACQKPVIATCFGGPSEVVVDGETGYIVNPFNVSLFAEKITDLLSHPEKVKEFGMAGYERAKVDFDLHSLTKMYLDRYVKM